MHRDRRSINWPPGAVGRRKTDRKNSWIGRRRAVARACINLGGSMKRRAVISLICILATSSPAISEEMETHHLGGEAQHRGGISGGRANEGVGAGLAIGIILNGVVHAKKSSDQGDTARRARKRSTATDRKPKRHAKKPDKEIGSEPGTPKKNVNPPELTDGTPKVPEGPTNKPSDPQPQEPTTTDKGGGTAAAPSAAAALTKCCSCLDLLRLTYMQAGPKQTPDTLIDVSDPEHGSYSEKKSLPRIPSHKFQVTVFFNTVRSKDQGDLTLKWFEKSVRVPPASSLAGQQPGQWADQQDLLPNSKVLVNKNTGKPTTADDKDRITFGEFVRAHGGTTTNWIKNYQDKKANVCKAKAEKDSTYIEDEPAAARPRKLEFHIVVESPKNCNCPTAALELYATQIIAVDPKEKDPTSIGKASQSAPNTGLYGPQGKLISPGWTITGVPPAAPQPIVPAE